MKSRHRKKRKLFFALLFCFNKKL